MTTGSKLDPRPGLYLVERTSNRSTDDPEKPPAEGAFLAKHDPYGNGNLYLYWFIEVPDLVEFADKYGAIILSRQHSGHMGIEIYDDYRE